MGRKRDRVGRPDNFDTGEEQFLKIIGGKFRGSKLRYHGDSIVRPMKHRVREAIFNLISTASRGRHALDLFAGTGALGLEAISRGAEGATFIEKHVPSASIVEENIGQLGVEAVCDLCVTSAFLWCRRDLPAFAPQTAADVRLPWVVFCSPPYAFYLEREEAMHDLVKRISEQAPPESLIVAESDEQFDIQRLPGEWDVRDYPPARVGVRWIGVEG